MISKPHKVYISGHHRQPCLSQMIMKENDLCMGTAQLNQVGEKCSLDLTLLRHSHAEIELLLLCRY